MSQYTEPGSDTTGALPSIGSAPSTSRRTTAGRLRTVAAFGVLGAAVAGTATVVMAASPSASPSASPTASGQLGTNGLGGGWAGPGGFGGGMGDRGGFGGGMGDRGGFGGGFDQVTVSAVSGSSISLQTADGWTRTIAITSSTTLTKGGQAITAADIKTGDTVRFSETRNTDGTYSITAIVVVVPEVHGTVTSVSGSTIQVKDRNGATWTVTTTGTTTFNLGPGAGKLSDVTDGSTVDVSGSQGTGNTITALSVRVQVPTVVGSVTAKSGSTLTIQGRDGTSITIHVGSSTTYAAPNVTSASLSDVAVGSTVRVSGTVRSDGSYDAIQVAVGGAGQGGPWGGLGGPAGALMPQG